MNIDAAVAVWRGLGRAHAGLPRLLGTGHALRPMRVAILLTHRCNLRCAMCIVPGAASAPGEELSPTEVRHVLDQTPSGAVVTFTGGEPLLRRDLQDILQTSAVTHRLHLVSNGTLLDTEWAEVLTSIAPKRLPGRGLVNLGVSVHGVGAVHDGIVGVPGSYAKAMEAVTEVAARRTSRFPLVDVKVVMTKDNVGHLVDLYREACRAGADICSFQIQSNQASSYGVAHKDREAHLQHPPPILGVDVKVLREDILAVRSLAREGGPLVRFSPDINLQAILDHYSNAVIFC